MDEHDIRLLREIRRVFGDRIFTAQDLLAEIAEDFWPYGARPRPPWLPGVHHPTKSFGRWLLKAQQHPDAPHKIVTHPRHSQGKRWQVVEW